ncbi:MAG: hypothetical protein AB7E37_05590 [Candidatus Altimarinota bacterium]
MDIIQQFESKLKIVGGEKVYSAREIMKILGYDKWERFLGAIQRAMLEINDETKKEENFFFTTDKSTGGRPREDVLLTLGACYFVLQKCDDRKENVRIIKEYLDEILSEKKSQQQTIYSFPKINMEKIFVICSILFLVFSVGFYLNNYTSFLNIKSNGSILDYKVTKREISEQKQKQEIVLKDYDNKIFAPKIEGKEVTLTAQVENNLFSYIEGIPQSGILKSYDLSEYKKFLDGFNLRTDFMKPFFGTGLIEAYFELGNQKAYRDSCSLLSTKMCLSGSKTNLIDFSNFWEKTLAGYTIKQIKEVENTPDKNIYCVEYRYKLKNDLSNEYITETFNFTTQKKGGYEQIAGRFCEKIEKGGRELKCPFELNTYYCK